LRPDRKIRFNPIQPTVKEDYYKNLAIPIQPQAVEIASVLIRFYKDIDPGRVIYDGELAKYNPGFKFQYITRFC